MRNRNLPPRQHVVILTAKGHNAILGRRAEYATGIRESVIEKKHRPFYVTITPETRRAGVVAPVSAIHSYQNKEKVVRHDVDTTRPRACSARLPKTFASTSRPPSNQSIARSIDTFNSFNHNDSEGRAECLTSRHVQQQIIRLMYAPRACIYISHTRARTRIRQR